MFSKIPAATIFTAVAAFLSGGLAGSVFTWYVNRPQPTIVTYAISTSSLGTSEVSSLVPELKLQIGNEAVSSLYTHTVDLAVARGPFVEQTAFAITFPDRIRVFGVRFMAPTSVQSIGCDAIPNGFRCTAGPLSSKVDKPFRVTIATGEQGAPTIQAAAKNVDFIGAGEYIKQNQEGLFSANSISTWISTLLLVFAVGQLAYLVRDILRDRRNSIKFKEEIKNLEERLGPDA
ncbi:MAG TPA: hypothetical protein VF938_00790 [Candidatus Angelobacter sp.]